MKKDLLTKFYLLLSTFMILCSIIQDSYKNYQAFPLGLPLTVFRKRLTEAFFSHRFVNYFLQNLESTGEIYFGTAKDWVHKNCADVPTPRKFKITENIQILYKRIVKPGNGKYLVDRPNYSERLSIV